MTDPLTYKLPPTGPVHVWAQLSDEGGWVWLLHHLEEWGQGNTFTFSVSDRCSCKILPVLFVVFLYVPCRKDRFSSVPSSTVFVLVLSQRWALSPAVSQQLYLLTVTVGESQIWILTAEIHQGHKHCNFINNISQLYLKLTQPKTKITNYHFVNYE